MTENCLTGSRNAIIADASRIAQLYAINFPEHIMVQRGLLTNVTYLEEHLASKTEQWIVYDSGKALIGVAALAMVPEVGLGEIERVCVDREHRGNGVAQTICSHLVELAREQNLGFVEAFARGDQYGMQRTFEKLNFTVYGVAPRFEIVHNGRIVREQFVHMGLLLKSMSVDESSLDLIGVAKRLHQQIHDCKY